MTTDFRSAVGATLLGLAAVIAAPPVSAAIITGSWDPPFETGSPLDGLGWTATVNLYVPDRCIEQSVPLGVVINLEGLFSVGCGPQFSWKPFAYIAAEIKVISAEVGIYDVETGGPDALLDVIRFNASTLPITILGFDDETDKPTFYIGGTSAAVWGSHSSTSACQFRLSLSDAKNTPTTAPFVSYVCDGTDVFTRSNSRPTKTEYSYELNSSPDDDTANRIKAETRLEVAPTDVPEPGSTALVLLALATAGLTTRRAIRQARPSRRCIT